MECTECKKIIGKNKIINNPKFNQKSKNKSSAVFSNPSLCKEHFTIYFENKVKKAIKDFKLLSKKDKLVVAASGGKDSTVLLYLLKKLGYNPEALAIDEGIRGYRSETLKNLKSFCKQNNITLNIVSYKKEFGEELDTMLHGLKIIPCSLCGTLRRYLLNKYSRKYNKIATGHNLDDESQSIVMNLLKNNLELNSRLGPKTGIDADRTAGTDANIKLQIQEISEGKGFVQRVKPLYFCTEKEVMAYTLLKGIKVDFAECSHVPESFRAHIRDMLNDYELSHPGTKKSIIKNFLNILPKLKKYYSRNYSNSAKNHEEKNSKTLRPCKICGEPSDNETCRACLFLAMVKSNNSKAKSLNNNLLQIRV